MPDREKVIKGVHDARRYLEDREWVDKSVGVHIDALNDALALLKEQEAVEPKHYNYEWRCGVCGHVVLTYCFDTNEGEMGKVMANFCPSCGRKVKWE